MVSASNSEKSTESVSHWYAFKTKPGAEARAEEHLVRQGFSVFMPKLKVTQRRGSRLVDRETWLFPGYGFVSFDADAAKWRSINGTRGVSYLIAQGDKPTALPQGFIESLRNSSDENVLSSLPYDLREGDAVEFLSGPFVNQIGSLVKMQPGGRIKVLFNLLSGSVHIDTRADNVFPV